MVSSAVSYLCTLEVQTSRTTSRKTPEIMLSHGVSGDCESLRIKGNWFHTKGLLLPRKEHVELLGAQ